MSRNDTEVEVELSSFALGKTEVTRAQWLVVMGTIRPEYREENENYPVTSVTWDEAMQFCEKLTKQEHLARRLPSNFKFTLPTEAQWEYACRAGTKTKYSFGLLGASGPRYKQLGNCMDKSLYKVPGSKVLAVFYCSKDVSLDEFIRFTGRYDDGFGEVAPVCSFHPNVWGLYDMHGNVAEWCLDYYYDDLPGSGKDPARTIPNPNGRYNTDRIVRGGSWMTPYFLCCDYSYIEHENPNNLLSSGLGFRVALVQSTNP